MGSIRAERCIAGPEVTEPQLSPDGTMLVHAQSVSGGSRLMLSLLDGSPLRQLTSYPQPRTGRGMGGGCFCWMPDSAGLVYAARDGHLWMQSVPGGACRRVTDHTGDRSAQAPAVSPSGDAVVYVLDECEVWLQPLPAGAALRLDDDVSDFCFDPCVSPDGTTVVWQAWDVPDMAWDSAFVRCVDLRSGERNEIRTRGAMQQPRYSADGALWTVCDETGWNNVWRDRSPMVDEPFEHGGPTWGMGQRSFAVSPDGRQVAFTRNELGFGRLCLADVVSGEVRDVARAVHGQLSWRGRRLAAVRTGARTPPQIVVHDTESWERTVIDIGAVSGWDDESLAEPELVAVAARDGATIFARLYRADERTDRLICWVHGGPTDQWQVTFMPRIAFWRDRGFNILVVDHRGSTGHGRAYQQAMNGRWGELDATDTIDAVRHAHEFGWGHPHRTVLVGASAGGLTVLCAAARAPDIAACASVSYPVTDLFDLTETSHRFELHSTHHLVGPIPQSRPQTGKWVERSPVMFADQITTPLLVMHGDADHVVSVEQSRALADRIVDAGGQVELVVYPGEGHGLRRPENQLDEYRRMEAFIGRHIGPHPLVPSADHIAPAAG